MPANRSPRVQRDRSLAGQVVAPLDPAGLDALAQDAVQALMAEGESDNTVRSYQAALRYWSAWFAMRYHRSIEMPVPTAAVVQFVVDHAQRKTDSGLSCELPREIDEALVARGFKARLGPPSLATLLHRLSVLSKAHQLQRLANPCQDVAVRELVSKTRRAYAKRGVAPDRKPALTREPLEALLQTCDDSLRGLRDRALLLFAWASGGRRRSEVADARMENLTRVGPAAFVYRLHRSKTDQSGSAAAQADKPVVGMAGVALAAWLARSGIVDGPLFRRVLRGEKLSTRGLASAAVRKIVRERAALAGLPEGFSAHSLRSGFVTEAARQNVPMAETMEMTGHASVASVVGYFRTTAAVSSRAAKLLDRPGDEPSV
ncbi:MAG: tyrosine-type recombinase/integrase [Rubrivivax sp.]